MHQVEALAAAGVTDIVLAVNYRPEIMVKALEKYEEQYGVKITFSVETEPLGTAGPLALAREILGKDDSPFFVLNSDVICEYPFVDLLKFHKAHGNDGTIVVTKVEEPSKYGVVVMHPNSTKIQSFVEKPTQFVSNRINAGLYILNPSMLDLIELKPTSIEKEIFPKMVSLGQLHSYDLKGYWMVGGHAGRNAYGAGCGPAQGLLDRHVPLPQLCAEEQPGETGHPWPECGQDKHHRAGAHRPVGKDRCRL